ncbi:STAS domain-containing protein [Streptomyces sp. NPDC102467]|uniref:STAS domain-containing protein n=1 Tax=Streptomyces sp. NPDC102467 TaxID=3366179 RepID=UPI0037FFA190
MADIHDTAEPSALLSITRSSVSGVSLLTARGEIDASSAPELAEALAGHVGETGEPPRTVLDLGAVTFMDSTGINALLIAHRATDAAGGWIRLACLDGPVLRVVELVGVDSVIACHPSVDQALSS